MEACVCEGGWYGCLRRVLMDVPLTLLKAPCRAKNYII